MTQQFPLHVLPADQLFRFYISDGKSTRAIFWFKCSRNGDLVTKPCSKVQRIFQTEGAFSNGRFVASSPLIDVGISPADKNAHPHLTFHPSAKQHSSPIINAPGGHTHLPKFDLRKIKEMHEVVKHVLATPDAYPIEKPKDQYNAIITNAYTATKVSELTFFASPIDLKSGSIPDNAIHPHAVARVICTQPSIPHSILIQVVHAMVDIPSTGNMHVMAVPVDHSDNF